MFRKKKNKKLAPSPGQASPNIAYSFNDYQSIDEMLGRNSAEITVDIEHELPKKESPQDPIYSEPLRNSNHEKKTSDETNKIKLSDNIATIVNASDDFKMNSLRRNTPDVLALSGSTDIGNNNDVIVAPSVDNDNTDAPVLPPPFVITNNTRDSVTSSIVSENGNTVTSVKSTNHGSDPHVDLGDIVQRDNGGNKVRFMLGDTQDGFDNQVFQSEHGPVPSSLKSLKSQQNKFPGLRKKVSWDENVVYTTPDQTEITLTGLQEETDTDDNKRVRLPQEGFYSYDGTGNGIIPDRKESRRSDGRFKRKSENKWPICCAVVLVSLAIVGIVVLGTMYGIRYANEKTTSEKIADIKLTFSLVPSSETSVFIFALYRPPADPSYDGATYFLLERESIMPWQSPTTTASLVWIQGTTLQVYIIDRRGRVLTHILGDPIAQAGAQYTVYMTKTDVYSASLSDPNGYALVALIQDSEQRSWIDANTSDLLTDLSSTTQKQIIMKYSRPKL